jgi:hypothetical protein
MYFKLGIVSLFILYVFSSTKSENRRVVWARECWHQWQGGGSGEKGKRMNKVQIMYTHVCKCKNNTLLKLFQESGEKE